ncbi:MAG TPA: hypothetical protein VEL76_08335 [Gemmataceae bacterium]|nr:hypothetical protein [Gemmataceae bacterium]
MIIDDLLTEDRWLHADTLDEAAWMVRCLWRDMKRPSPRKGQLFVCACAREIWYLLTDERSRQGVEVAERYLEGLASRSEVEAVAEAAFEASRAAENYSMHFWASVVAAIAARPRENRFNDWKAPNAMRSLNLEHPERPATFLRDIFGNPFHPKMVQPCWLANHNGVVMNLAQAIYEGRTFDHLPILADALEEAGCDDAEMVNHCRQPGVHARGCWVLDLLLNRE